MCSCNPVILIFVDHVPPRKLETWAAMQAAACSVCLRFLFLAKGDQNLSGGSHRGKILIHSTLARGYTGRPRLRWRRRYFNPLPSHEGRQQKPPIPHLSISNPLCNLHNHILYRSEIILTSFLVFANYILHFQCESTGIFMCA